MHLCNRALIAHRTRALGAKVGPLDVLKLLLRRLSCARPTAVDGDGLARQPAVVGLDAERVGQLLVQLKGGACERAYGRAVVPIERQEATRLAGGGGCDAHAVDQHHILAALARREVVGDRGADDAAAADDDPAVGVGRCR